MILSRNPSVVFRQAGDQCKITITITFPTTPRSDLAAVDKVVKTSVSLFPHVMGDIMFNAANLISDQHASGDCLSLQWTDLGGFDSHVQPGSKPEESQVLSQHSLGRVGCGQRMREAQ
ncbi:hypothetical protein ElyMa_003814700 [Elysia marginata]|uniref:Uncharacterized protein n=1 Tax=Elysia marginata TaxID=1093978 RepID=A0AAV4FEK6_9GAST|nr:hypothetical protein ElyMa_003814700 [Elysia marginata]